MQLRIAHGMLPSKDGGTPHDSSSPSHMTARLEYTGGMPFDSHYIEHQPHVATTRGTHTQHVWSTPSKCLRDALTPVSSTPRKHLHPR